jgi:hypothetical protein
MASWADRYRACAAVCTTVDYSSRASVRRYNRASDQMRSIVVEAFQAGPGAVAELLPLLDAPPADEWIAFQLLDLGLPPLVVELSRFAAGSGNSFASVNTPSGVLPERH